MEKTSSSSATRRETTAFVTVFRPVWTQRRIVGIESSLTESDGTEKVKRISRSNRARRKVRPKGEENERTLQRQLDQRMQGLPILRDPYERCPLVR
jgi:hypothetical protein